MKDNPPDHCGNACDSFKPEGCDQDHWCECCGDCRFCYNEMCYDGCSHH